MVEKGYFKFHIILFNIILVIFFIIFLFKSTKKAMIMLILIFGINVLLIYFLREEVDEAFFGGQLGEKIKLGFGFKRKKEKD